MTESNLARSINARLLNMADGDNKKYQRLIVRYCHERLLYRLSKSGYRERFILKGGALLYAFEEFMPRPTLDIVSWEIRQTMIKKVFWLHSKLLLQCHSPKME